jgi:hypothetical protein
VSADSKDELADKIKAAIENRFQIWMDEAAHL